MDRMDRLATVILLNLLAFGLLLSWFLPPVHLFWCSINSSIFVFLNHLAIQSHADVLL